MRYVWDMCDDYFDRGASLAVRALMPPVAATLRGWDRTASRRVHRFVAISRHVAQRIRRCYDCEADVIYPPVDMRRFALAEEAPEDFYLVVSALVSYKRLDLAIEAANRLRLSLRHRRSAAP